jgi:tetratricopeptide (TPR) repeat protein
MVVFLKKIVPTLLLLLLAVWVVRHGVLWRTIEKRDYVFDESRPGGLQHFARAWYDHGMRAWYQNRLDAAADHFQKAICINVFHVDAWLRLAQVEAARGNAGASIRILTFAYELTRDVVDWKWPQLILARDLGLEDIFFENINFVISYPPLRNDAIQLVDIHMNRDSADVMKRLEPRHLPDYLYWLMKWNRVDDSILVWDAAMEKGLINDDVYERYARFLLGRQAFRQAAWSRSQYKGTDEVINNPGFEEPFSNSAFGWRVLSGPGADIRRVRHDAKEGDYALQATFSGKVNLNANIINQIVPVVPGASGSLSFWWRSRDLTTDKHPFLEIRCLEGRGRQSWQSPMVPTTSGWQKENIIFEIPQGCHAVRISLRRHKSNRFDNLIKGVLWLDDFQLEVAPSFLKQ